MSNFKIEHSTLDWNDLKVVLAVARAGSLVQAAPLLGTSHPTLHRRLKAIESCLNATLFQRDKRGHQPTEAAGELIALAQHIEGEMHRIGLQMAKLQQEPMGKVRLTTPDTLMQTLVAPLLAGLRQKFSSLTLEVSCSDAMYDLTQREADVALRAGSTPPENLIGYKVGTIAVCAYAPIDWTDASFSEATHFPWIVPDDNLRHLASAAWLHEQGLTKHPAARGNSLSSIAAMAQAGIGLALLPCYLGDTSPNLRRLNSPMPALASDLWILTHSELRKVQRVRNLIEHLREGLQAQRALLEGEQPQS